MTVGIDGHASIQEPSPRETEPILLKHIPHRVDENTRAFAEAEHKKKTGKSCVIMESREFGGGKAWAFLALDRTDVKKPRMVTLAALGELSDIREHPADRYFWLACSPEEVSLMYAQYIGCKEKLWLISCLKATDPIGSLDAQFYGLDTSTFYELRIRDFVVVTAGIKKPSEE